ncbi:MAG TPA: hypothetical protein VIL96_04960 [Gaiellaceae bacterium]
MTPRLLIELLADEPDRARRFWEGLLQTTLESREPGRGRGWQTEYDGIVFGLHERGPGPGDRFSPPTSRSPTSPPRSSGFARSAARSSIRASAG